MLRSGIILLRSLFFVSVVHEYENIYSQDCTKCKTLRKLEKSLDNGGRMLYNNILYHNVFLCLFCSSSAGFFTPSA